MDETGFRAYLKKGGRSETAIQRCITYVKEFQIFLKETALREVGVDELDGFVSWVEKNGAKSAKGYLWALRYYFDFVSKESLREYAGALRQKRIKRKAFRLGKFRDVNPEHVDRLTSVGVTNVEEILKAGSTPDQRRTLSETSGVPRPAILEFVKLSDLARVQGLKNIRARLYYDAGVDTIEKLAACDPSELRELLIRFIEDSGFDGIAPTPKEARSAVKQARKLPIIVEYD